MSGVVGNDTSAEMPTVSGPTSIGNAWESAPNAVTGSALKFHRSLESTDQSRSSSTAASSSCCACVSAASENVGDVTYASAASASTNP
jgi:hypothetical protein